MARFCTNPASVQHAYFPNDAVVSLLVVVEDKALEVGLVGREGMMGIPLVLGEDISAVRALVQGTGTSGSPAGC
jgi:hypothetical protein